MNRILLIDDSQLVSQMVKEFLSSHGFDVLMAQDANQGYQMALQQHPDLILLDIHLPDVTGFEVCKVLRAKAETKETPIIMITGAANQTEHKVKGFQVGADDYILKPFDNEELLGRIRAILKRSRRTPSTAQASPALKDVLESPADVILPLPILRAVKTALVAPHHFPTDRDLPEGAMTYFGILLALVLSSQAIVPGGASKLILAGMTTCVLWGSLTAGLVIGSSLTGIPLGWRMGSRLLSLAGIPILLKMAGAFVCTLWTTLSPFYFTASPLLVWRTAPSWVGRIDLFELSAVGLLAILLQKRSPHSDRRGWWLAGALWLLSVVLGMVTQRVWTSW